MLVRKVRCMENLSFREEMEELSLLYLYQMRRSLEQALDENLSEPYRIMTILDLQMLDQIIEERKEILSNERDRNND